MLLFRGELNWQQWQNAVYTNVPGIHQAMANMQVPMRKVAMAKIDAGTLVCSAPSVERDVKELFPYLKVKKIDVLYIPTGTIDYPEKWVIQKDYTPVAIPINGSDGDTGKTTDASPSVDVNALVNDPTSLWNIIKWPLIAVAGFLIYKNVKGVRHARN